MKRVALLNPNWQYDKSIFLPLSLGMLAAYCEDDEEFRREYEIDHDFLFVRDDPEVLAKRVLDSGARVLGCSTYIWNEQLCLDVARRVKAADPTVLVVVGGQSISQWPEVNEAFLRAHPYVDVTVRGEGEITFKELLLTHARQPWGWRSKYAIATADTGVVNIGGLLVKLGPLPGISYLTGDSHFYSPFDTPGNYEFVFGPERKRERDLEVFPSPYLEGTFDRIMEKHPELDWQGLWETNRGCPYECSFCSWSALALGAKLGLFGKERLFKEIDWFAEKKIRHVYCCDANAGILPRDTEWVDALVTAKGSKGFPKSFFVNTAKNATRKIFDLAKKLHDAGMSKSMILSMQSMDETTLENVRRDNIKLDTYHELQRLARDAGMATCSELILGLPGETLDSFCHGVENEIEARQFAIFMYFCVVLPASEMARPQYMEQHGIQTARVTILSNHADLAENDRSLPEFEDVVVATKTMPYEDWIEANRVAWFVYSFVCLGLAAFPLLWAQSLGVRVTDLARLMMPRFRDAGPLLRREAARIDDYVASIRNGSPTVPRYGIEDSLEIRWPIEEATFLALQKDANLDAFYVEFQNVFEHVMLERGHILNPSLVDEVFEYQRSRIVRVNGPQEYETHYEWNLPEYFDALLKLGKPELKRAPQMLAVTGLPAKSFDDFSKTNVWFARRGGSFFYPSTYYALESQ